MTKVLGYVDTQIVVYPNGEMLTMSQEEYERIAIDAVLAVYYTVHEDFEEISND